MSIEPIGHDIHCVDLHPLGLEEYISAYVVDRGQVAVIDCGPSSTIENLLDAMAEMEIDPAEIRQILLTHIHVDHAGGAGLLSKKAPQAKIYVHEQGAYHLVHPEFLWSSTKKVLGELAEEYGEVQPVPKSSVVPLSGGERIHLDTTEIAVVETPGHAPHHLCFWDIPSSGIFTGDAAGIYVRKQDCLLPTTPPPNFDLELSLTSLTRLMALQADRLYYTHFGRRKDARAHLEAYSRRLRLWVDTVLQGVEEGFNEQEIRDQLARTDPHLRKIEGISGRDRLIHESSVLFSIQGIMRYLRSSDSLSRES